MFVLSWQHRNLKCSDTRIRLTRAWEAYFYRSEGGEKKSSRIVWLLHNAMPALLEMLSQNGNEKKARSTAYILPKGFYTNMNSGKYHSHWLIAHLDYSHHTLTVFHQEKLVLSLLFESKVQKVTIIYTLLSMTSECCACNLQRASKL